MSPFASVLHLTTVHRRYDTRVFVKECRSLVAAGYRVTLFVRDGQGDEESAGVRIVDLGPAHGLARRFLSLWETWRAARNARADVVHLHEPELVPVGWLLKWSGVRVVYDVHEDHPRRILHKRNRFPVRAPLLAALFQWLENSVCQRFDLLVAATPKLRDRFVVVNPATVLVRNYPILDELVLVETPWEERERAVIYMGGISPQRGVLECLRAVEELDLEFFIAGQISSPAFEAELRAQPGWEKVTFLGYLGREALARLMARPRIGLVTLLPMDNYIESLPVKMFEYMAVGLPVIASDFPLWESLVEESGAGICVPPDKPERIAAAIRELLEDPGLARHMGERGRLQVRERFNWAREEAVLLESYSTLLAERDGAGGTA